jgi:hypothetical protein
LTALRATDAIRRPLPPSRATIWIDSYGQLVEQSEQPMQCGSIRISKDFVPRWIESTGQPSMQYGVWHDRHDVATKYWPNRGPSRKSRLCPSPCESAHALVHSSQRVQRSRSSTSIRWPW